MILLITIVKIDHGNPLTVLESFKHYTVMFVSVRQARMQMSRTPGWVMEAFKLSSMSDRRESGAMRLKMDNNQNFT